MQATDQPRLFSISAVATALDVSPSIIRIWERDGLIDAPMRIGGDARRVYREDEVEVIRLLAESRRRQRRQQRQRQQPAQHS